MKLVLLSLMLSITQILVAQTFFEVTDTPIDSVRYSSVAFADIDGDSDQDLLITGLNFSGFRVTKLYFNDGAGNFTDKTRDQFQNVDHGSVAFADVDGDGDQDVLITGRIGDFARIATLYTNDGTGTFSEVTDSPFKPVSFGSVAFADVDDDGDQDVSIIGLDLRGRLSKLYTNDGAGNFTPVAASSFVGTYNGSIAFEDVDGDSDQDLLITGFSQPEPIAKMYINDGEGEFFESTSSSFDGVSDGSVAFADVDGDNDQDVLITGHNNLNRPSAKLYINDGAGNFAGMRGTPFEEVEFSSAHFVDIDGDSDLDVFLTGRNASFETTAKLYTNDGLGIFTEVMDTPFEKLFECSIAFADVDGDGDLDVLMTGMDMYFYATTKLYINGGVSSVTPNSKIEFELSAYPNPTKVNQLNINYDSPKNSDLIISIFDLKGSLISQRKEFIVAGFQTVTLDITSVPPGTYVVQLDTGKERGTAKFVVE